jgi:hypothetical protein
MKKIILLLTLFICAGLSAQKGKGIFSRWNGNGDQGMNPDTADYTNIKHGKIFYFLSNDNEFIYLFLRIKDAGVQHNILEQGLIVWVNMDNKTVKKMGIRFPIGSQNSVGKKKPGAADLLFDSDGKPATALSLANTIELVGFLNENPRRFPAENPDSFRGSVRFDNDGILHYKLAMPIEKLPVRNSRDGVGAMPVVLGIEYFTAALSSDNQENKGPSGVPSGRRGGGAPGGRRSGGRSTGGQGQGNFNARGNSNSNQNNAPYVLFWIKNIKLATDK